MYCVYKHKRIIIIIEMVWNSKIPLLASQTRRSHFDCTNIFEELPNSQYSTTMLCRIHRLHGKRIRRFCTLYLLPLLTKNCRIQASSLMDITQPASSACHTLALPIRTTAGKMYSIWPDNKQM
ncbi:hypothetical protein HBI49_112970 [Parastagonospora nodorum]|nr:hypothetical protein HBI49_112970 [Parastagonospora nodorum]KAH5391039.1 hypothetical protein HBI32_237900 [Parastagonospora nodorum]KAH6239932.1 hypothetical protein HBI15_035040 [Parastagonospora nodorum]